MRNFEQIRSHLLTAGFRLTMQEPYVACVELSLEGGSRHQSIFISELDGVPYLQLCENRPYDGLTPAEVERLVLEIGGLGDRMERALSAEGDLL